MKKKDRDFLVRAQAVTENYERRIDELTEKITSIGESDLRGNVSAYINYMELTERLDRLMDEYFEHHKRYERLTEQLKNERALNSLCTDANKLAGVAGGNFWTRAGRGVEAPADVKFK